MKNSHKVIDPSRRGFLTGSWLPQEWRQLPAQALGPLGPEPPISASHFSNALCNNCGGRCLSVCEAGVIRLHPKEHYLAGTPWLDFSSAGCTLCGKCADVCPQTEVPPVDAGRSIGFAEIDLARCLSYTGVFCISCQGSCEYQAIQRDRLSRPKILSDVCTGCGECVSVCPVKAISVLCNH